MLQIENEYETPKESNDYQNNHNNLQNPDNIQEIIDYTEQELKEVQAETISIKMHQTKHNYLKKNFGQNHFFLEIPQKKRISVTRRRH